MAIGWFICSYNRRDPKPGIPGRYCAMDDFTPQITADGGAWVEAECNGNSAVVKVRASAATLFAINAAPGFLGIAGSKLNDPLSSLTPAAKNTLRTKIVGLGYTANELTAALGSDLGAVTLGQLLAFVLTRRLTPRYDQATDTILVNGVAQSCTPIEVIDSQVV